MYLAVNEESLGMLISMGYSIDMCTKALTETGGDLERYDMILVVAVNVVMCM